MNSKAQTASSANAQFINPTAQQLRSLVLDYLCHKCYIRTARAFARDSLVRHLDADGDEVVRPEGEGDTVGVTDEDLHQVELRRDIQSNILAGRVDDATEVLNTHFPSVLAQSMPAPIPRRKSVPPSHSDTIDGILPFTVEPAHLYLDLRVLAFIEVSRTRPLLPVSHTPHPPSFPADPIPSRASTPSNFRAPTAEDEDDVRLELLLSHVCKLYDCVNSLRDPADRVEYQEELSKISTLLAYKVPEHSPVAKYLSQERRQTVADEINSAILYRAGRPTTSYLELYIRYNTVLWNFMNEQGHKLPPPASKPGLRLPPRRRTSVSYTALPAKDQPINDPEVIPPFDLHQFLSS